MLMLETVKTGCISIVLSSSFSVPVSVAAVRSGAAGVEGSSVSMVMVIEDPSVVFPAESILVAYTV